MLNYFTESTTLFVAIICTNKAFSDLRLVPLEVHSDYADEGFSSDLDLQRKDVTCVLLGCEHESYQKMTLRVPATSWSLALTGLLKKVNIVRVSIEACNWEETC